MKTANLIFYIVLFLLGLAVCYGSLRLGYGEVSMPGSGFLPFWCGVIISFISLGLIFHEHILGKFQSDKISRPEKIDFTSPLLILVSMTFYGILFQTLGFTICNLIFLAVLFRFVWKKSLLYIVVSSMLINVGFLILFKFLLRIRIPSGILGTSSFF